MLSYCKVKPMVNQVELHPILTQEELVKFFLGNQIIPTAID
jgi:L-glyceraldehyde reductase